MNISVKLEGEGAVEKLRAMARARYRRACDLDEDGEREAAQQLRLMAIHLNGAADEIEAMM